MIHIISSVDKPTIGVMFQMDGGQSLTIGASKFVSIIPLGWNHMKVKTALLSCIALCAVHVIAADWTPIQVSLFPPVQIFASDTEIIGFRLNVLIGYSAKVTGLDVGVEVNQVAEMSGVQIALMNQALCFDGIQVGLGNQIGSLGPPRLEAHKQVVQPGALSRNSGIQIGLLNGVGRTSPFSFDETESCFLGLQIGVLNAGDVIRGVQLGTLANFADEITGLQLSGLWNQARILHGVQIGLINRTGNGPLCNTRWGGVPIINAAF